MARAGGAGAVTHGREPVARPGLPPWRRPAPVSLRGRAAAGRGRLAVIAAGAGGGAATPAAEDH